MGLKSFCFPLIAFVAVTTAYLADGECYLRVTLHLFSGRPPPQWDIGRQNRNFDRILSEVTGHNSTALAPILGYSGFTVEEFGDGVLRRSLDVGRCTRPEFELLLLETVEDMPPVGASQPLRNSTLQYVREPIQSCIRN
ncbi:uncharacterized protein LOC123554488 isoform X2 [Mercenaria mercenaria]|uniref:uncharacterized protein LOC123554488 isoform X2 n=1 Tax=Mercenaria mercenaria TaxID=6596 RepID=UPI00234F798B|nr:uncharacterized protein LOC123554488 isoform X2 [Mercenaria mercenaria]